MDKGTVLNAEIRKGFLEEMTLDKALETEGGPGRVLGEEYPGRKVGAHSRLRYNKVDKRDL